MLESYCSSNDAVAQFDCGRSIVHITYTLVDNLRRPLQSEMEMDNIHWIAFINWKLNVFGHLSLQSMT